MENSVLQYFPCSDQELKYLFTYRAPKEGAFAGKKEKKKVKKWMRGKKKRKGRREREGNREKRPARKQESEKAWLRERKQARKKEGKEEIWSKL